MEHISDQAYIGHWMKQIIPAVTWTPTTLYMTSVNLWIHRRSNCRKHQIWCLLVTCRDTPFLMPTGKMTYCECYYSRRTILIYIMQLFSQPGSSWYENCCYGHLLHLPKQRHCKCDSFGTFIKGCETEYCF
jgi:hypothetical protein